MTFFRELLESVVHCIIGRNLREETGVDQQRAAAETSGTPQFRSGDDEAMDAPLSQAIEMMPSTSHSLPVNPGDNLREFNLKQLKKATKDFSTDDLLGQGKFGYVTYGKIEDLNNSDALIEVAVKSMYTRSPKGYQHWLAEMKFLGQLSHPNIVKLIGYCQEGDNMLLVYEYMPKRSLDEHLYSTGDIQDSSVGSTLSWATRVKVAHGAAMGLNYLHNQQPPVIHNDIKSSNILLDESYNAKLSDFGCAMEGNIRIRDQRERYNAKLSDFGPAPPERGKQKNAFISSDSNDASDVERFGVVLLEILTGQKDFDKERVNEVFDKRTKHAAGMVYDIVDKRLESHYGIESACKFVMIIANCFLEEGKRPRMEGVMRTLEEILQALNESDESNQFIPT